MREIHRAPNDGNVGPLWVRPRLRLIPNGIDPETGGVKATLLLSPVPVDDDGDRVGACNLLDWPAEAAALLAVDDDGRFAGIEAGFSAERPDALTWSNDVRPAKAGWMEAFGKAAPELGRLWRDSLVWPDFAHPEEVWAHLAATLKANAGGTAVAAGSEFDPPDTTADPAEDDAPIIDPPEFGRDGQIVTRTGHETICAAILGSGLADAAVALELRRAHECLQTLADEGALTRRAVAPPDFSADLSVPDIPRPRRMDLATQLVWLARKVPYDAEPPTGLDQADWAGLSAERKSRLFFAYRLWERARDDEVIKGIVEWTTFDAFQQELVEIDAAADAEPVLTQALKARVLAAKAGQRVGRFKALRNILQKARMEGWKSYKEAVAPGPTRVCRYDAKQPSGLIGQGDPEGTGTTLAVALSDPLNHVEYGRYASYDDATDPGPGGPAFNESDRDAALAREKEHIGQTYFSIEQDPGAARVFGLAIDVIAAFPAALIDTRFGLIAARLSGAAREAEAPRVLTRIKLRTVTETGPKPWGWPVTAAEVRAARDGTGLPQDCIAQYDGVMVMGGAPDLPGGGRGAPRFDIAALDVRAALEAERNWRETILAAQATDGESGDGRGPLDDAAIVGPDYQSGGLSLMNRSAAADVARKLAELEKKVGRRVACEEAGTCAEGDYVVHDAEDVTSGYRLLLGVPDGTVPLRTGAGPGAVLPTLWRSLMGRVNGYGRTGEGGDLVAELLDIAMGPEGSPARVALESALQIPPTRDLPTGTADKVETIVEEVFAHWDGSPGGVACARVKGQPGAPPSAMIYGKTLDVPSDRDTKRPSQFRNGRPYRLALQAVFSGGLAIPLDAMPVENPAAPDATGRLYVPSRAAAAEAGKGAAPYARALRHARLQAPTVLLPSGHARRENGPMGYDSCGKMVVRTMRGGDGRQASRAAPRVSQRLLLVPGVPQAMAARHLSDAGERMGPSGLLDGSPLSDSVPAGALSDLRYDLASDSGFPVAETVTVRGIDNARYLRSRKIVAGAGEAAIGEDSEQANAVYQARDGRRATRYFPDPAADHIVLRLRRAGADLRPPLHDAPVAIPLSDVAYPEKRRVLLSLRAGDLPQSAEAPPLNGDRIFDRGIRRIISRRTGDIVVAGARDRVREVALKLFPGEHFVLETWLVPSALRLAHDFALVQSMAQVLGLWGGGRDAAAVARGLASAGLQGPLWAQLARDLSDLGDEGNEGDEGLCYFGTGGEVVPGTAVLRRIGATVHKAMLAHPVHEISAVRRVELLHATNVHDAPPVARALTGGIDALLAADRKAPAGEPAPLCALRPAGLEVDGAPGDSGLAARAAPIASGSKHLLLAGEAAVDLERIDTLEILAKTVSPDSSIFDDPKRGRSLANRLAGAWPDRVGPDGEGRVFRKAFEIFGFELAPDGRVRLPEAEIVLLRIDDIPIPAGGGTDARVDLAAHFAQWVEDEADPDRIAALLGLGRTSSRHLFPDGKARRMRVWINGLARTAEAMTTAARELRAGDPWLGGEGIVHEAGELLDPQPLPRALMENFSEEVEVILPATIRPAELQIREARPLFEQRCSSRPGHCGTRTIVVEREAMTQLRFARGWFSSGVEERLGIVIWPPNMAASDQAALAANRVPIRYGPPEGRTPVATGQSCPTPTLGDTAPPGAEDRVADLTKHGAGDLPDFSETDLGPGGRFVTMRGMDPTKLPDTARGGRYPGPVATQIFASKEQFPDLWRSLGDPRLAEYVPMVQVPLGDPASEPAGAVTQDDAPPIVVDTVPPLSAGLVTYVPRFDPIAEEWYVDVRLSGAPRADEIVRFGLVRYQPHTRPDLRCSRPAAVMAHPLEDRRLEISRSQDGDLLIVRLSGPMSRGILHEYGSFDEPFSRQMTERTAPVMRVTAFATGTSVLGAPIRVPVALRQRSSESQLVTTRPDLDVAEVMPDPDGDFWQLAITIDQNDPKLRGSLHLKVEEIEYRLPSTLDGEVSEPMDPLDLNGLDSRDWGERNAGFHEVLNVADLLPATEMSDEEEDAACETE